MSKKAQTQAEKGRQFVSAFEENSSRFALVTKDNKINVYDTASGKLNLQCSSSATSKLNNQYTSIAWGKSVKVTKGQIGGTNDVVVGTNNGSIYVWNLLTSEIVASLGEKGEGHTGAVNDIIFLQQRGAAGITLYSCGADGYVIQWDLVNKKPALKWQANSASGGVSKIAVYTAGSRTLLATADTSIRVWDIASQKTLIKFPADKVTSLQFTPDGDYLMATGTDRVINMWSVKEQDISANKKNSSRSFSCDSIPIALRINKNKGKKNSNQFLALTEGGLINLFDTNTTSKGITPASGTVKIEAPEANGTGTFGLYFVDAHFYNGEELAIALGPETDPSFQRLKFATDAGITKALTVTPRASAAVDLIHKTVNKNTKLPTTLDASSLPPPNVVEGKKRKKTETTIAKEDSKKIAAIEKSLQESAAATDKNITFQAALEQAIHTNDQQLLVRCLTVSNYEVIKSTLLKLAPSFIIPLVKLMIALLQGPAHHQAIYSYLHIIVSHHTSLLMSSGALRDCAALYSAINARSASYLDLLKCKGRVDLLLAHLDQAQTAVVVDTNAKNVYSDTKKKEDEDEDEEGEDAEDVEMGSESGSGSGSESEGEGEGDEEEGEGESEEGEEEESFIGVNGDEEDDSEEEDDLPKKRSKVVDSDDD